MHICLISYWFCPREKVGILRAGGANIYILNFANHLGQLGHTVDIFTPFHSVSHDSLTELDEKVRIIHLHKVVGDRYKDAVVFAKKVYKFIKTHSEKYDIIHTHYYYSGIAGGELKKNIKVPNLITFHTLGIMKKRYAGILDEKRILTEKEIIEKANGIIASTELEKRELVASYGAKKEKIFVVSPGVDHQIFRPYNQVDSRRRLKLPQKMKIVLFVGRVDPIKGISLIIQAVSHITKIHKEFEKKFRVLLIGGDISSRNFWRNPEVQKIRYMIGVNNLDCCVKFIGSRPHDILPYFYSASDLVILPSYYESFGLVVLEAMSCRKAVIASRVGGLQYLIDDNQNGLLFESGDYQELAEITWDILSDDKRRKKLGDNALKYSLNYSWQNLAEKMVTVYKKLI